MKRTECPSHPEDLLLAQACTRGDRAALRQLTGQITAALEPMFIRFRVPQSDRADLRQSLLERLLVTSPERAAKIGGYRGQGPLISWVRVCAAREVLSQRRKRQWMVSGSEQAYSLSSEDPETIALRDEQEARVTSALHTALTGISQADHQLLSAYVVSGQNSEFLGRQLGVHRVTVVRRINRLRAQLLERVVEAVKGTPIYSA